MIMIHGGGWRSGCRKNVQSLADMARDAGYIVFSIDYRMSCEETDPPFSDNVEKMCDHYAPHALADIQAAVPFFRAETTPSFSNGEGEWIKHLNEAEDMTALGFSSGGNLAFMLGVLGDTASDTDLQVVGGFSGPTEIGLLDNGGASRVDDPCDGAWSQKQAACRGARNDYVGPHVGVDEFFCNDARSELDTAERRLDRLF
jgi:acetyl esterase/lipase